MTEEHTQKVGACLNRKLFDTASKRSSVLYSNCDKMRQDITTTTLIWRKSDACNNFCRSAVLLHDSH